MKELNKNSNKMKKILILVAIILVAVFIFIKAEIFIKEKTDETVNLVINNNNVTSRLKNEVKIENGIIYVSKDDMKNFFDKYIYVEDEIQEVVTTYEDKIASIGFESNKLTLNGATKKISAHAIKENDVIYLPLSEMIDVYNIEINNIEDTKIIIVDSLNREQIKADIKSKVSVKSTGKIFSKTISKLQKGESVIVVGNSEETEKNGWLK